MLPEPTEAQKQEYEQRDRFREWIKTLSIADIFAMRNYYAWAKDGTYSDDSHERRSAWYHSMLLQEYYRRLNELNL